MFDINNGFIQKLHLKINSCFSIFMKKIFGYEQHQVVICGFPRGGTSLLYNMVSSTLPNFKYTNFEKYFIFNLHKIGNIASKAPLDIMHLDYIDSFNINQKKLIILIVVRDIRDVITSRHPIYPDNYFIGYDHSWWPQNESLTEWNYDAPGVLDVHNSIVKFIDRPDTMLIKYEDLVCKSDVIQNNIESMFNLKFTSLFSEFHMRSEKHAYNYSGRYAPKYSELVFENKKVSSERVNRWMNDKQSIERIKGQFIACPELFSVLEYYGYEKSRRWFESL